MREMVANEAGFHGRVKQEEGKKEVRIKLRGTLSPHSNCSVS